MPRWGNVLVVVAMGLIFLGFSAFATMDPVCAANRPQRGCMDPTAVGWVLILVALLLLVLARVGKRRAWWE